MTETLDTLRGVTLHRAEADDLAVVTHLRRQGRALMLSRDLMQWNEADVSEEEARRDLEKDEVYLLCYEDIPVATARFVLTGEPDYASLRGGRWESNEKYLTVHRVARLQNAPVRGLGSLIFDFAARMARQNGMTHLRVDTHRGNAAMQRVIQKNGFSLRGVITLSAPGEDRERLAYEKSLT